MKWENTLDKYWTGNKAIWLERGGLWRQTEDKVVG